MSCSASWRRACSRRSSITSSSAIARFLRLWDSLRPCEGPSLSTSSGPSSCSEASTGRQWTPSMRCSRMPQRSLASTPYISPQTMPACPKKLLSRRAARTSRAKTQGIPPVYTPGGICRPYPRKTAGFVGSPGAACQESQALSCGGNRISSQKLVCFHAIGACW